MWYFIFRMTNSLTYYGVFLMSTQLDGNRFLNYTLSSIIEYPAFFLQINLINRYVYYARFKVQFCVLVHNLLIFCFLKEIIKSIDGINYTEHTLFSKWWPHWYLVWSCVCPNKMGIRPPEVELCGEKKRLKAEYKRPASSWNNLFASIKKRTRITSLLEIMPNYTWFTVFPEYFAINRSVKEHSSELCFSGREINGRLCISTRALWKHVDIHSIFKIVWNASFVHSTFETNKSGDCLFL